MAITLVGELTSKPMAKLSAATEIAAAVTNASKQGDAARALIRQLTSPEAKAMFKAKGLAMGL